MQIGHEDALQLEPWMSWVQAYADLLLRCAARWAKGQASGAACADVLPCIRLLPDSYFTKHLDEVHTHGHSQPCAAVPPMQIPAACRLGLLQPTKTSAMYLSHLSSFGQCPSMVKSHTSQRGPTVSLAGRRMPSTHARGAR